jgi:hypothetical protein
MSPAQAHALLAAGFMEHGAPKAARPRARSRSKAIGLTERSALALTEEGVAFAVRQLAQAQPVTLRCGDQVAILPPVLVRTPCWNAGTGELRYGGRLVKRFRRDAHTQRTVLDAFQAATWAARIENPLQGTRGKRRLRYTIEGLHTGQRPLVLRFRADGRGGMTWEAME